MCQQLETGSVKYGNLQFNCSLESAIELKYCSNTATGLGRGEMDLTLARALELDCTKNQNPG